MKTAGSRTETGQGTSTSTPGKGLGGTGRRSIPRATCVPKLRRWRFIYSDGILLHYAQRSERPRAALVAAC